MVLSKLCLHTWWSLSAPITRVQCRIVDLLAVNSSSSGVSPANDIREVSFLAADQGPVEASIAATAGLYVLRRHRRPSRRDSFHLAASGSSLVVLPLQWSLPLAQTAKSRPTHATRGDRVAAMCVRGAANWLFPLTFKIARLAASS